MTRYLLDTNVLAEATLPRPHPTVLRRLGETDGECALAAVGWHELHFGVERLAPGRRRDGLKDWLHLVGQRYDVLPYDRAAAQWHAVERARLADAGNPGPAADAQIAAVAATRRLILVTRNVMDFDRFSDLAIESWWD